MSDSSKLKTPARLTDQAREEIAVGLTTLLADVFTVFIKTKNFHWHVSGAHFRDYHLLLDEQAAALFAITDPIAERARKLGATTLRSIGQLASLKRIAENEQDFVRPVNMLDELRDDNLALIGHMHELHDVCDENGDIATASLLEDWIDEADERVWFLTETARAA
ncbi:DNA starvation/stationary phase protection protein [Paraburkholderia sp.]|jgi:starvation-inducible DNA-binding protein|uniref:Dps family protein n=1 Tax=Paraburkholderia sp. TaxID=1926495 RepID=UPI002F4215F3